MAMTIIQNAAVIEEVADGQRGTITVNGRWYEGRFQSVSIRKGVIRFNTSLLGRTTQHVFQIADVEAVTVDGRQLGGSSGFGNAAMEGRDLNQRLAAIR